MVLVGLGVSLLRRDPLVSLTVIRNLARNVVLHVRDILHVTPYIIRSLRLTMPSTLSHTLPQNENMMKTHYPMMVVPVRLLLGLERLLPHQEMLQRGLLLPYNQLSMKGRVMFISHQCTYSSRNPKRM